MDLSTQEAREAYEELSNALRDHQLEWVVEEVEEQIALGKIQTKRIRAKQHRDLLDTVGYERRPPKTKTEVFAVSEEYSPVERLEILLKAIVLALSETNSVAEATFDNLGRFGLEDELVFEPEAEVSESYEVSRVETAGRKEAAASVVALVNELRGGGNIANPTESTR